MQTECATKMTEYIVTKINGIYHVYYSENSYYINHHANDPIWKTFIYESSETQRHFKNYESRGISQIQFQHCSQCLAIGNFKLDLKIEGRWWSKNDFGNTYWYTLGWKVTDNTGQSKTIVIKGSSIESTISKFLNSLAQFDTLEEYISLEEASNNQDWGLKEITDKICSLAKIIELYNKYKQINPALAIVTEIEELVEKRLKEILS